MALFMTDYKKVRRLLSGFNFHENTKKLQMPLRSFSQGKLRRARVISLKS